MPLTTDGRLVTPSRRVVRIADRRVASVSPVTRQSR